MTEDEKFEAGEEFVSRSINSMRGWARRGGPNKHLSLDELQELAYLRARVRMYQLEHPAPLKENPPMPF